MIEKFGVRGTEVDGVFFTEAEIPGASFVRHVEVEISRQNSNLGEVKSRLAATVKSAGAAALMNFKYGQRKHRWWEYLLFKWDTESWYGEGDAVSR